MRHWLAGAAASFMTSQPVCKFSMKVSNIDVEPSSVTNNFL